MITNITVGVDPSRIQQNRPAFFVSWKIDGQQEYYFSALRSSVELVKKHLEMNAAKMAFELESTLTA